MKKIIIFVFLALILGFLFYFFKNDLLKEKVKKIHTPNKIYNSPCLYGTPKMYAASAPDHAPVSGKGIATKIMSARAPNF